MREINTDSSNTYNSNCRMTSNQGITVIISMQSGIGSVNALINSILEKSNNFPQDFIVTDNNNLISASEEKSLPHKYAYIKIIRNGQNNLAYLLNDAANLAVYPVIVFLADDLIFEDDILIQAEKLISKPTVGLVGISTNKADREKKDINDSNSYLGEVYYVWDEQLGLPQPRYHEFIRKGITKQIKNVPAVNEKFLMLRRNDFLKIGGFFDRYKGNAVFLDLCLQIQSKLQKEIWAIVDKRVGLQEDKQFVPNLEILDSCQSDKVIFNNRLKDAIDSSLINKDYYLISPKKDLHIHSDDPPNIIFLLPSDNHGELIKQATLLANSLNNNGAACKLALPDPIAESFIEDKQKGLTVCYSDLVKQQNIFQDQRYYDIIHSWTPRENARRLAGFIKIFSSKPLIVHLTDNETQRTEKETGYSEDALLQMSEKDIDLIIGLNNYHPTKGRKCLENAFGITMSAPSLSIYNYSNAPQAVIIPSADERYYYPRPLYYSVRERYGVDAEKTLIVFKGNINKGNIYETIQFTKALEILNQKGFCVEMIQVGSIEKKGLDEAIFNDAPYFRSINESNQQEVSAIMAAADILASISNTSLGYDYSTMCQLSEYQAIGRPIIVPKTDCSNLLKHGKEAYILDTMNAEEVVSAVINIVGSDDFAGSLAAGAAAFYRTNACVSLMSKRLLSFYSACLKRNWE